MINSVVNNLLDIYEKMNKFESEENLADLRTLFYNAKKALYITIKELQKDTEELQRLQNSTVIFGAKDYNKILIHIKNKEAKEQLEQYIKYIEEFRQKWSQKQD